MDAEEVYIHLRALRQLYMLLLKSCCRGLQDANLILLDEKARVLFKHLLDEATARAFQAHSKMLTTELGVSQSEELPKAAIISNKKQCRDCTHSHLKQTNLERGTILSRDESHHDGLSASSLTPTDKQKDKVAQWMKCKRNSRKTRKAEVEDGGPSMVSSSFSRRIRQIDLLDGIGLAIRRIEFQILSCRHMRNGILNEAELGMGIGIGSSPLTMTCSAAADHHNLIGVSKGAKGVESSLTQASKTSHSSEFVQGFRIPLSQHHEPYHNNRIPKENRVMDTMVPKHSLSLSVRPKQSQTRRIEQERCRNLPVPMIIRPMMFNQPTPTPARGLRKTESETHKNTLVGRHIQNRHNANSESASSSWETTTQQSRAFSSETIDYPSSPSHQEGSSFEKSSISSSARTRTGHYLNRNYPPNRTVSTKSLRFRHEKTIGRIKRLKNKLGLIFHHHHHHHHKVDDHRENFMWKHLRNIFHSGDKKKVIGKERGNGKLRNSAMKRVGRRNQTGQFQSIAEGLFRSHIWKPKVMKKGKEVRAGMVRREKGVKKLHWWRLFHRRRGVKIAHKGRVKIGYVNRKAAV